MRHYPACGGCRFQDLAYEAQLDAKAQQVADALRRIGGFPDVELEPAEAARSVFHYRNKLEYSFTTLADGAVGLGFHRAGRWDEVLDVERCWLTTDLGNGIREAVKAWARAEGLPAYDQERQEGYLRHLVVREGRNTGQALVVLVTAPGDLAGAEGARRGAPLLPGGALVHWAVNDSPAEVTNLPTDLLWGEEAIEEEILGLRYRVRPNAFLQTNTEMCEVLYSVAREYAGLTGDETVYDLYCGIGTIGLTLARDALTVWGIEFSEESIACAVENAELNGLANAAFFAGDVGRRPRRAPGPRRPAGRRRRRPAARGARGQGRPPGGRAPGAAARLRLLQPDDARRKREAARRRTSATASSACARWTCSRTPRTSRPSPSSRELAADRLGQALELLRRLLGARDGEDVLRGQPSCARGSRSRGSRPRPPRGRSRPAQLHVRPEQRPVRARPRLVGHADAAGVDQALARDPPVELDVRVAADDDRLLDPDKRRRHPLLGRDRGQDLLVASRRAVTEEDRAKPVDGHGLRVRQRRQPGPLPRSSCSADQRVRSAQRSS